MMNVDTFNRGLYEEHLEEAAFLYEQRVRGMEDLELTWRDLADYESRRDAHLNGLVCGGNHAFAVCREAALDGGPGELFCGFFLACRQHTVEPLLALMRDFTPDEEEQVAAIVEALVHVCPHAWFPRLAAFAEKKGPAYLPIILRVLAWHRNPLGFDLLNNHVEQEDGLGGAFPWAAGRLGARVHMSHLRRVLEKQTKNYDLRETALALLRLGDRELAPFLAKRARKPWARLALALCGGPGHPNKLMNATPTSSSSLLGLGILGDVAGVPALLGYLRRPQVAPIAARALELITGAHLVERAWIPEEPDEDVYSPAELEAWKKGEPIKNPNGNPAGEYVERISHNINTWLAWWRHHEAQFTAGKRYRRGKLLTPNCLLQGMQDPETPGMLRELAHHELFIRYGCSAVFELEMTVPLQERVLVQIQKWVEQNNDRFEPGAWYCHGEMMKG
ncbi:hypothetical protein [Acanthopleuribacter pedis]|uniref:HEAT repeat domain-containing protein n=1 Tax=Acanthopleuribacter pedis TaxID=442870 RepID=A0A8J7U6H7_9BACT|nr:hypothetical protein [Acanthopleuribacter pedis]MBO1321463.1 hypothetical protein [Acanthopleuribacter pedis]